MFSAPEFADYLIASTRLSRDEQKRLVFLWLDRCIRVHCAAALERCDRAASGERIRKLAVIGEVAQLKLALGQLESATHTIPGKTSEEMAALTCFYSLAGNLPKDRGEAGFNFHNVIITILTAARCAGAEHEEKDMLADAGATHGPLH